MSYSRFRASMRGWVSPVTFCIVAQASWVNPLAQFPGSPVCQPNDFVRGEVSVATCWLTVKVRVGLHAQHGSDRRFLHCDGALAVVPGRPGRSPLGCVGSLSTGSPSGRGCAFDRTLRAPRRLELPLLTLRVCVFYRAKSKGFSQVGGGLGSLKTPQSALAH